MKFKVTFFWRIGNLWLLWNDSVKLKLLSLLSFICLQDLISVVMSGDESSDGSTF